MDQKLRPEVSSQHNLVFNSKDRGQRKTYQDGDKEKRKSLGQSTFHRLCIGSAKYWGHNELRWWHVIIKKPKEGTFSKEAILKSCLLTIHRYSISAMGI